MNKSLELDQRLGKLHRVVMSPNGVFEGVVDYPHCLRWIDLGRVGAQVVVPIRSNGGADNHGNLMYEVVSPLNELRCWVHAYNLIQLPAAWVQDNGPAAGQTALCDTARR